MNKTIDILLSIIQYNLISFWKEISGKVIDLIIWAILSIFVTGIILPQMGLTSTFSNLQFATILASIGIFEGYGEIFSWVADINNKKSINYELCYPISSIYLFLIKVIINTIKFSILTIIIGILSKLIFWNFISLQNLSLLKLIIIIIFANFFYGTLIIFTTSFINSMNEMSKIWSRFIFPIWFMGGFQFTWEALFKVNKLIAFADLLNPIIYITKAFQIAFWQPEQNSIFWICILGIIFFSFICFTIGYKRIQKKLDFI